MQKFAYGKELKSKLINSLGGHIASFFCLVPFNQWRILNCDPTPDAHHAMTIEKKFFPPINTLIYSMKNYWNIK